MALWTTVGQLRALCQRFWMRTLQAVAAHQFGAFRTGQALADGRTSHALRHAVRHDDLERLAPGVYGAPTARTDNRWAEATLRRAGAATALAHPRLVLSHSAAGAVARLALLHAPPRVCVTYPRPFRGQVGGAHLHRARLHPGGVHDYGEIRATSHARTILDLARECGVDAGFVAADDALRRGLVTMDDLNATAAQCAGWPYLRRAAPLLELADGTAESPLESLSRLRIARAGLPRPRPLTIIRVNGRFVARTDFYWDEFGVVAEADGARKYVTEQETPPERTRRQGELEDAGIIVVRWGWADLDDFTSAAARLQAAFARAMRPDRAPRVYQAEFTRAACHPPRAPG